jgi:hypothetical protein
VRLDPQHVSALVVSVEVKVDLQPSLIGSLSLRVLCVVSSPRSE